MRYEQHLLLRRAADAISCGGACSGRSRYCFCNSMCCLPCSCAFKLQLVSVPALGLVWAVGYKQHLLLFLLFFLLFFLLRAADAISCGGTCSGRSRYYFCNYMCCLPCSCAFKFQLVPVPALGSVRTLGYEQYLLLLLLFFLLFFC